MSDDSNGNPPPKVGYKSPPVKSQFRKGQSGNPTGRPKGSGSLPAAFAGIGDHMITMREGDKARRVSFAEMAIRQLFAKATKGNAMARRELIKRCRLAGAFASWREAQPQPGGVVVVSTELRTPEGIAAYKRFQAERAARGEKEDPNRIPAYVLPASAKD